MNLLELSTSLEPFQVSIFYLSIYLSIYLFIYLGGRNVAKATYIPHSYSRSQNSWIEDFYTSNSYLEVSFFTIYMDV